MIAKNKQGIQRPIKKQKLYLVKIIKNVKLTKEFLV